MESRLMRKVGVVICGQIRNADLFKTALGKYVEAREMRTINSIIYSTWYGHIDQHEGMRDYLCGLGVGLVESDEPQAFSVSIAGSYFRQAKNFYLGAQQLDPDSWVLKTRADLVIGDIEDIYRLINADYSIRPNLRASSPFQQRIWSPYFEITIPFYIADMVLFGTRADLLSIYNLDARFDMIGQHYSVDGVLHLERIHEMGPEIRMFLQPFENIYPILSEYRRSYTYHIMSKAAYEINMSSKLYYEYLSLYYLIVHNFFKIGGSVCGGNMSAICQLNADGRSGGSHRFQQIFPMRFIDISQIGVNFIFRNGGLAFCDHSMWLDKIFANPTGAQEIQERLTDGLVRALNYEANSQRDAEFLQYQIQLVSALNQR